MATLTKTLKFPFMRLNQSKAAEFARLESLNTEVANRILALPKELGVAIDAVRPHYTSKTCHHCGALNERKKHAYVCSRCGHKAHADANAGQNIRDWYGLCCPLDLEGLSGGPHEPALNPVSKTAAQAAA